MITSASSGSNASVSITLVGRAGMRHKVQQITWSYSSAPAGSLSTTGFEGDELAFDITAGGPGGLALPPSAYGAVGASVVVSLAAGGGGITGKINVFSELE